LASYRIPQTGIEIREVRSRRELKTFLRFPWKIYERDPHWVPPLLKEQAFHFSPKNPFLKHAEIVPFVALKEGIVAGRIAAIVDRNYIDYQREKVGFFGFFECIRDITVAQTLLEHVKNQVRNKGMEGLLGPLNPSTNDECGLLVEGFDAPPFFMMPHNPPYYRDLLEQCGLHKVKDLFANLIVDDGSIPARIVRVHDRVRKRLSGLNIRSINMKMLHDEVQKFQEIYNEAWRDNWGFVPPTAEELDVMIKRLRPLTDPDLALFAEVGTEPVAFALALPNYNVVLKRLNGTLGLLGLLKFFYFSRKIDEMRILLLGVKSRYQKRGLETLLYVEIFRRGQKKGYQRGEMSWILEDNHLMQKGIEALGGRKYKTYRIYQCSL